MIPNMTILAPKDGNEFYKMLLWSQSFNGPLSIRYPKNYALDSECADIEYGKWEVVVSEKSNIYILAAGGRALRAASRRQFKRYKRALYKTSRHRISKFNK